MNSMTGYGRCEEVVCGLDIIVEIKSVNHRYFEFSARIPKAYGYLEVPLKELLKSSATRGKIEIGVYIYHIEGVDSDISINEKAARGYIEALRKCGENFGLNDDISLSTLVLVPDIFNVCEVKDKEEDIIEDVLGVAKKALWQFNNMRAVEGENLKKDIAEKLDNIEGMVSKIEELAPSMAKEYYNKLHTKLLEILAEKDIDDNILVTEAAVFADKVAVDEETVRLRSHIGQMREIITKGGAVGKKLDFIIQEMNRETNTIGSKASDIKITNYVVDIKSEIEKIREQVQNVE